MAILLVLALAGCGGSAPAVDNPSKVMATDGATSGRWCVNNAPPVGYKGPLPPSAGTSCPAGTIPPANVEVPPAQSFRNGLPPYAVRGEKR